MERNILSCVRRNRRDTILKSIYRIPSENPDNKLYKLNYVRGISKKILDIL